MISAYNRDVFNIYKYLCGGFFLLRNLLVEKLTLAIRFLIAFGEVFGMSIKNGFKRFCPLILAN
jgi:hypothetical protein